MALRRIIFLIMVFSHSLFFAKNRRPDTPADGCFGFDDRSADLWFDVAPDDSDKPCLPEGLVLAYHTKLSGMTVEAYDCLSIQEASLILTAVINNDFDAVVYCVLKESSLWLKESGFDEESDEHIAYAPDDYPILTYCSDSSEGTKIRDFLLQLITTVYTGDSVSYVAAAEELFPDDVLRVRRLVGEVS